MLKLKKVQILGFKSFCDRTEVPLTGEGIAAIVGPNGCGKSNISDAITWVLGEQSAKSLRGIKMEDVIFAGTRDRKPTGMAEVSLTLIDPTVYDAALPAEPEISIDDVSDWDENVSRAQRAAETEEAVAEAQPGVILNEEELAAAENAAAEAALAGDPNADASLAAVTDAATAAPSSGDMGSGESAANKDAVVLKIRRRKFNQTPARAGEIVVTRRLFRSGESEYLLNGKICRLRDILDIFMGTGLGGETYAMIGQERIGQILSSKPLDRRGIIEEAAGITRFKTKKRLAELRLEAAKQNLARVNDIFEEVTKQMASLKRQAAKAERFREVQTELRARLTVVLASRMAQQDAEHAAVEIQIAALSAQIDTQTAEVETMDAEHTAGIHRGYELDQSVREASQLANQSAVELERIAARTAANADRAAELSARMEAGAADIESAQQQLATLAAEQEQHRSFLDTAVTEAASSRQAAQHHQQQAQQAVQQVVAAERAAEQNRYASLQLVDRVGRIRAERAQAESTLAALDAESARLTAESEAARAELAALGTQRGQAKLSFESVTERLAGLETHIASLREQLEARRSEERETRRRGDQLRAEMATLLGRRNSLDALIREHSYSTDTVRNLFRANAAASSPSAPVGTLADFLEVDGQYESVVDEFLRDELNYIVVKNWDAADEGMRMLRTDVNGRATFLVHPNDSQANFPFAEGQASTTSADIAGVVPLKNCVRVLDGFGKSLEVVLPRLREGFIAPDVMTARSLALSNPQSYFLTPGGETFHNVTVTGGRPNTEGPLALKRELRDVQQKLDAVEAELSQADTHAASLQRQIAELTTALDTASDDRRAAERESANSGAALRQMEAESARIERRLEEWSLAAERNRDRHTKNQDLIAARTEEAAQLESERAAIESALAASQDTVAELRARREELQAAAAAAAATLAGIEERRRNTQANFDQTSRMFASQQQRIAQIEQQIASAAAEKLRREEESAQLAAQHTQLAESRATALADGARLAKEAEELRAAMAELDQRLRTLRHDTEALREQRAGLSARAAKLASDIQHLNETALNDLNLEAAVLREDASIQRIEGELLTTEEEAARALKQKLENMGPVNMMALEEYTEITQRHAFLETQRKDLLDSIENTQQSIKEIDDVSRLKFEEAFKVINDNFSNTFTKLFGGGQASMRLTDAENANESGIDILASPPGKKLQNILLLSGGEKALTALSLLVGIFQFQPAPFCVLDEVDAPLDETNVGRFAQLIAEMSSTTQFIVITHSKRTMQQADVIYGVTMQEPGCSKIVSVNLGNTNRNNANRPAA